MAVLLQDKTAQFVSRNGTDFEKRILANEKDNVKFQFLQASSPFHAYYQLKIAESKAADAAPAGTAAPAAAAAAAAPAAAPAKAAVAAAALKATGPPAAEMYTVRRIGAPLSPRPFFQGALGALGKLWRLQGYPVLAALAARAVGSRRRRGDAQWRLHAHHAIALHPPPHGDCLLVFSLSRRCTCRRGWRCSSWT